VIASHYAEPLARMLERDAVLRSVPSADAEGLGTILTGEPFLMLDESLGWAWGYGGHERRVGYLEAKALA
jgi:hypothetical protein